MFPTSSLPPVLVLTTIDAATALLRGVHRTSPAVLLMKGVLSAMWLHRLQTRTALLLAAGAVASMAVLSARAVARPDEPPKKPAAAPAKPAARPLRDVLRDAARAAPDGDTKAAYVLLQIAKAQAAPGTRPGPWRPHAGSRRPSRGWAPRPRPRS